MTKLSPAQALPLLEQAVKDGHGFMNSAEEIARHTSAWIGHVTHILSDVEGVTASVLSAIAEDGDYTNRYLSSLNEDRVTVDYAEWQKGALGSAINITATQILILRAKTNHVSATAIVAGKKVFIGHGRDPAWMELEKFLDKDLHIEVVEFNSIPTAGMTIIDRLKSMLDSVGFAFLIMTAEDHVGKKQDAIRARQNVIHEIGLFQGRLGFNRSIILLEEGCQKFSNIDGLVYIGFPAGRIRSAFHDVRATLEAAGLVKPIAP